MSVERIRQYIAAHWPIVLMYGGLFVVLATALFWQLGTLLPGYSPNELAAYERSLSLRGLLDNPLNAPFILAVKAAIFVGADTLLATRLVAATVGATVVLAFTVLLRRWHDTGTALFGTLLFGLSAWMLHIARLGTPEVMMFGVFLLAASGFWLRKTNHWLALITCFVLAATLLYVPGMIWFIAVGLLWQWKTIARIFKKHLGLVTVGALLFVAALGPLAWAVYKDHGLIMPLLGLPETLPPLLTMAENLLKVPFHLFVHNGANPETWLGTAPILDVFSLSMFVLGGYLYLRKLRLMRTPLFISILVVTGLLIATGGPVTFTVIIPFIYLVIAAGISYLLAQWFKVFPRNPIARSIGWTAVGLLVAAACAYQIGHYFVGWPEATATNDVFVVRKP